MILGMLVLWFALSITAGLLLGLIGSRVTAVRRHGPDHIHAASHRSIKTTD